MEQQLGLSEREPAQTETLSVGTTGDFEGGNRMTGEASAALSGTVEMAG